MGLFDWWIMLLPAVFIVGWAAGRIDMRKVVDQARLTPRTVRDGVAELLSGNRRQAAENFLAAGEPDRETAGLHFAAGQLHRELGNYEHAIRVHKSLLAAPGLDSEARAHARFELGLDFFRGGFLDLAELCFKQLGDTPYAQRSWEHLFKIHFRTRNWEQAIDDYRRMLKTESSPEFRRHIVAHLYCEWAGEMPPADQRRAELLDMALGTDPTCCRAVLMRGDLELSRGQPDEALKRWRPLLSRRAITPLLAGRLLKAHSATGAAQRGEAVLRELLASHPSRLLFASVCEALATQRGWEAVRGIAREFLRSIGGRGAAVKWLEAAVCAAKGERREELENLITALRGTERCYRCSNCSHRASEHSWQCPLCEGWETYGPVRKSEIDE